MHREIGERYETSYAFFNIVSIAGSSLAGWLWWGTDSRCTYGGARDSPARGCSDWPVGAAPRISERGGYYDPSSSPRTD